MRSLLVAFLVASAIGGCGWMYRQPLHQGNLLEEKNIAQLQEGLTRRQVLVLLGTPSISDPFHQARWDYFSSQRRGHGKPEIKNLTLWFDGDSLARWEGEYFPEQDQQLVREMLKFGNLPRERDKDKKRR